MPDIPSLDKLIVFMTNAAGFPAMLSNLIVAQAKHETGQYTSTVFTADNNLFGYMYVGQAGATQGISKPGGGYYAHYSSWGGSVTELINWIKRRQNEGKFPADLATITTPQQYASLLKDSGYYTDSVSNYTAGLIRWFQSLPGAAKVGIGTGLLLAIGAVAFFLFRKKRRKTV